MVRPLHRKLLRDLGAMWGPVFSISLVVTCGVSAYVTLQGTYDSLVRSRDAYYAAERFGHVFLHLERAPEAVTARLRELPGVAHAYTRIVGDARVPVPGVSEPALGQVVSIPDAGPPPINGLRLVAGRMPRADHPDEAVLLEAFAEAHGVEPGDSLTAVLGGREHTLRVVGVAMSPEFVFAVAGGAISPDPDRFAVLWMPRSAVESVYDLSGSFNDVVVRLQPGASARGVAQELDRALDAYGALGAVTRERQASNLFLNQELMQLEGLATFAPALFLAVAAFLLNVVLSRTIQLQRPQIATLKALGYGNGEVGRHYLTLALVIVLVGCSAGLGLGAWMGRGMVTLYTDFFRMPVLTFRMSPRVGLVSVLASGLAACVGAWTSVRQVVRLAPAEAMRPAAPTRYHQGPLSRLVARVSGPAVRMVWREVARRPLRLGLSALGIGLGVAILVLGRSFGDAMDMLVDVYMQTAQREDLVVTFDRPIEHGAQRSLALLPGVRRVEWLGSVPVKLHHGPREKTTVLMAHTLDDELRPLLDAELRRRHAPEQGVLLTRTLAEMLDVHAGEMLRLEPLEGDRGVRQVRVAGTIPEMVGLAAHMEAEPLYALLGRVPAASGAVLRVDPAQRDALQRALLEFPAVVGMAEKQDAIDQFREQSAESLGVFSSILTLFAVVIAAGVVYNNARVTLSMRSRDLASLRVLGFTLPEISRILVGELAVQVLLSLPIGLALGNLFTRAVMSNTDPELFRLPVQVSHQAYAFAALVTLGAAAASALLIRRRLHRLDLIAVLKTRE